MAQEEEPLQPQHWSFFSPCPNYAWLPHQSGVIGQGRGRKPSEVIATQVGSGILSNLCLLGSIDYANVDPTDADNWLPDAESSGSLCGLDVWRTPLKFIFKQVNKGRFMCQTLRTMNRRPAGEEFEYNKERSDCNGGKLLRKQRFSWMPLGGL